MALEQFGASALRRSPIIDSWMMHALSNVDGL
jgi:hypothetical protein